jgi:hypothetical protein
MKTLKTKMNLIENLCAGAMLIVTWVISFFSFQRGENWTALLISPERNLMLVLSPIGAALFCFLLYRFSCNVHYPQKRLTFFTALCMPLSLMFVFDPMNHPMQSNIHLFFSYLYFFGVNLSFMTSLYQLHFTETKLFQQISQGYLFILLVVGMMYMHYMSINTLFEVTFTTGMTLLLATAVRKTS